MTYLPTPEDARDVGEPRFSLMDLVLPGTSVGVVHPRALLLGELHQVTGGLWRIQAEQTCGDALSVSRGDRRCRNQRNQRRGPEKEAGVLQVGVLEDGHGDVSLLVDAPLKAQWTWYDDMVKLYQGDQSA